MFGGLQRLRIMERDPSGPVRSWLGYQHRRHSNHGLHVAVGLRGHRHLLLLRRDRMHRCGSHYSRLRRLLIWMGGRRKEVEVVTR
jgi:hypothetical protein